MYLKCQAQVNANDNGANKLQMIFDDENSAEGMDSGEQSDLDRQLENESENEVRTQ